jgi:hypothetical protein
MSPYAITLVSFCFSLLAVYVTADSDATGQSPFWQDGVLCRGANNQIRSCTKADHTVAYDKFKDSLAGSSRWLVLTSTSSEATGPAAPRFVVLSRLLQPKEANVQFAQAFCVSIGGQLAYWTSPKEYVVLSSLVRALAAEHRSPIYAYVGVVQLPGSQRPQDGWIWLHKPWKISKAFPWAANEPNDHNEGKFQGHTEDCAVLATYHKASEKNITDDFPCNYATPAGKFMFSGHNPHLTVACRLGPVQNL